MLIGLRVGSQIYVFVCLPILGIKILMGKVGVPFSCLVVLRNTNLRKLNIRRELTAKRKILADEEDLCSVQ